MHARGHREQHALHRARSAARSLRHGLLRSGRAVAGTLWGGRSILILATLSTALALLFGVTIGLGSAYNRGKTDTLLMRLMDILLAFPALLLALVALTTVGPEPWLIVLIVAVGTLPRITRVTRARRCRWSSGTSWPLQRRSARAGRASCAELLPNISGPLLVEANLRLTTPSAPSPPSASSGSPPGQKPPTGA